MPPTTKRRSSGSSHRSKRSRSNNDPEIRALDPLLLTRGMSPRYLVNTPLEILTNDEMERDIRHIEAYSNACTAYAQQLYLYTNHQYANSHQNRPVAQVPSHQQQAPLLKPPTSMPVRIDPEEEKRLSVLRKRIAVAESERELLETEYMSLTAQYVHESQRLDHARNFTDGHLQLLQALVKKRGTILALKRVRVAMARDIQVCLNARTQLAEAPKGSGSLMQSDSNQEEEDVVDVWNDVESQLFQAERDCRSLQTEWTQKAGKKNVVPWEAPTMPRTPPGVPLLLSQLVRVPDKGAAFGCDGMYGSKEKSMCWLENNFPKSASEIAEEESDLRQITEEEEFLRQELQTERDANRDLQREIGIRRKRNDELSTMMGLLRSETESLVHRHNVLLETPEARAVSQELHSKAVAERQRAEAQAAAAAQPTTSESPVQEVAEAVQEAHPPHNEEADMDHDGDDEGEEGEEEEGLEEDEQAPPEEVSF